MIPFDFIKLANNEINYLFEELEEKDFDADLNEEILYIYLNKSTVYVINRHNNTKQIWLSSPMSGAHKFSYIESRWQNGYSSLRELLAKELKVEL